MRLVSVFVAGTIEDAVRYCNEGNLAEGFVQMLSSCVIEDSSVLGRGGVPLPSSRCVEGHTIIARVTTHRATVIEKEQRDA